MPEDRRLAAIMFTDIVGYTKLMGSDEDQAFKILAINREIHKTILSRHNGTLIKEMGDGILASFTSNSDAVRCAIEIQQEVKAENIKLRIGIHEGEMVFAGSDVLGDGVNVASRLEELAEEGCIIVSGAVYKDIKNKAGIVAKFIEEKTLKNVEEPVKVYMVYSVEGNRNEESTKSEESQKARNKLPYYIIAGLVVVIAAILIWFLSSNDNDSQTTEVTDEVIDKSIAVLPFRNDSPSQENEYFCNGMVEEILTHLQKIEDLKVKSRTSIEQYRNPNKDLTTIARELEVAFILEGSVRKSGDDLRITAQLIDGESGDHIWAETFDGDYTEQIFDFQSTVAKQVASSLNAVITPKEDQRIERVPTNDMKAYDFYIRAHYEQLKYWKTLDYKHLNEAHDLYDEALELDPDFTIAITGKGTIFMAERNYDSALAYADRAITIDPEAYDSYGLRGTCYELQSKYDLAIENYLKAISLSGDRSLWWKVALGNTYSFQKNGLIKALPHLEKGLQMDKESLPTVYSIIGNSFANVGDYKKAEEYYQRCLMLKPSCVVIGNYSKILTIQKKYSQAFHFLDSVCSEQSCVMVCHKYKFYTHLALKEFDQAEQQLLQLSEIGGTFYLNDRYEYPHYIGDSILLAYIYKELGKKNKAMTILDNSCKNLESKLAEDKLWFTYLYLSFAHAILEEEEKALKYLSKAGELGFQEGFHDFIEIHPIFENLRDNPEFIAIVKRAQDEKAAIRAQVQEMIESGEIDL